MSDEPTRGAPPKRGSGTTGIAALQAGRRFLGIEADDQWHALAAERLQSAADPMHAMQRQNDKAEAPSLSEVDPPAAG